MGGFLPSPELVRELLSYDRDTGRLYWRPRPVSMFSDGGHSAAHTCAKWNSRWAGKEAFTADSHGYRTGAIAGRNIRAHRVIWAIVHGRWPDRLDHVDGDRGHNRLENLREVSQSDNLRNACRRSDNSSGITGVYWSKEREKWAAFIKAERVISLGRYETFAEAVAARRAAEKVLRYHPNHGRDPGKATSGP